MTSITLRQRYIVVRIDWRTPLTEISMRFATLIVEQLDRAATELAVNHPLNARMALILIDNAAELVIHRRCEDLVRADRTHAPPNLTPPTPPSILVHSSRQTLNFLEQITPTS